jgi:hypothetical protein
LPSNIANKWFDSIGKFLTAAVKNNLFTTHGILSSIEPGQANELPLEA